MTDFQSFRTAV